MAIADVGPGNYVGLRRRVSLLALVVVNLLPLLGVLLFGWDVAAQAPPEMLIAFIALMISHGISLLFNFVLAGEVSRTSARQLMSAPYGRIAVLHIAIIIGGMGVMALGQPIAMLAVLVILKLILDIGLHLREHRRLAD